MCVRASLVLPLVTAHTLSYDADLDYMGMAAGIAMRENTDARQ